MNIEEVLLGARTWALLGLFLVTFELIVPGLVSFFLGVAAFTIAGLLSFGYIAGAASALTLWFILSIVYILVFQLVFKRFFPSVETYDEYEEDQLALGTIVVVVDTVSPEHDRGRIYFRGTTWNARSKVEIKAGENAILCGREGLFWSVRPVEKI